MTKHKLLHQTEGFAKGSIFQNQEVFGIKALLFVLKNQ